MRDHTCASFRHLLMPATGSTNARNQELTKGTIMDENRLAYWLLGDATLPSSRDATKLEQFKAYLKHTLVFNVFRQQLLLSDSICLNNLNLRRSIRDDPSIRQLVQDQIFAVAVRAPNDERPNEPRDLVDLVEEFIKDKKHGVAFAENEYRNTFELELLRDNARIVPYSERMLARQYITQVLDLFDGRVGRHYLGDELSHHIVIYAREELQNTGKLGWIFFHQKLQEKLRRAIWDANREIIDMIASAPYHPGLPTLIDADPIYAKRHSKAFEITRGHMVNEELSNRVFRFSSRLGLVAYAKGISLLSRTAILDLLDTDEAAAVADARTKLDGSDDSASALELAMEQYQYVIDEKIVFENRDLTLESVDGSDREVGLSFSEWLDLAGMAKDLVSICLLVPGAVDFFLTMLFIDPVKQKVFHLKDQVDEAIRRERERAARLASQTESLRTEFDRDAPEKIEWDVRWSRRHGIETSYN